MSEDLSKIIQPTAEQVKEARMLLGLTHEEAGKIVHAPWRSWQNWETPKVEDKKTNHRKMPAASWELFLIKTGLKRFSNLKKDQDIE